MTTMHFTESDIIPEYDSIPEGFSMLDDAVIFTNPVMPSNELLNNESDHTDQLGTIDEEGREKSDEKIIRKGSREGRERKDSRERKRSMEQMDGLDDAASKVVNSVIETAVGIVRKDEEFKSFDPNVEFVSEPGFSSWGNVLGQDPVYVHDGVTEEFSLIEKEKDVDNECVSLKDTDGMNTLGAEIPDLQSEQQSQAEFDAWDRILDTPSTSDFQIEPHSDIEIESRTTFESNPTTEPFSHDDVLAALDEAPAYLAGVGFAEIKIERATPDVEADLDIHWKKGHTKRKYEGEERMAEPYMDDMKESFRRGESLCFNRSDTFYEELEEAAPCSAIEEVLSNDNLTEHSPVPISDVEFADVMIERAAPNDDHVDLHCKKERKKHRYEGEVRAEAYLDEDMKIDENYCEESVEKCLEEEVAPGVMFSEVTVTSSTPDHPDLHWKKDRTKHKYEDKAKYEGEDPIEAEKAKIECALRRPSETSSTVPQVMFAEVTVTSSTPDHPDLHWKKDRTKHKYEGEVKHEPELVTNEFIAHDAQSQPIVQNAEPESSNNATYTPQVNFNSVTITRSSPDTDIHWKKSRTKHKYGGEVKCEPLSKEDLKEAIMQDDPELKLKTLLFHILAVVISISILTVFYPDLDENLSLPCIISCLLYFSLCVYNDTIHRSPSPTFKTWMLDLFSYIVLPLAIGSCMLEMYEMYLEPDSEDVFVVSSVVSTALCFVEVVLLRFSVDFKMLPLCVVFPVCSNFFLKRWMQGEEPEILPEILQN